jgi:hypothetical protein
MRAFAHSRIGHAGICRESSPPCRRLAPSILSVGCIPRSHFLHPLLNTCGQQNTMDELLTRTAKGRFMKSLKMLGLAALMAFMAMAFVGASSAIAESTSLCKVDAGEKECEPQSFIEHVHEASAGELTLLNSLLNVSCEVLFLGNVEEVGSPEVIVGDLSYSNCENNCTITEVSAHSVVKILRTEHETGEATSEGEIEVICSGFISCVYSTNELLATVKGPLLAEQENGEVSIQEQTIKKVKGFLCPKTAKLDITTTPLEATYVQVPGAALRRLCVEVDEGFYLTNNGGTCATRDTQRLGKFDLAWVPIGTAAGTQLCVPIIDGGYYLDDVCNGAAKDAKKVGYREIAIVR